MAGFFPLKIMLWIAGHGIWGFGFLAVSLFIKNHHAPEVEAISITKSNQRRNHTPGELIFFDDFDTLDLETWRHENTFGSTTWQFQMFTNSRSNSYSQNGTLFIKPTLTSDAFGVDFLYNAQWALEGAYPVDMCTDPTNYGCKRSSHYPDLVNPVISAKLKTIESFYFKYGRVEIRAKVPAGDWMWPSIMLLPRFNSYGSWPRSGGIRIMESRGNQLYFDFYGYNIGSEQVRCALHFGPFLELDQQKKTSAFKTSTSGLGFDRNFHIYGLLWTDEYIEFSVDGNPIKTVRPPSGGFWQYGAFDDLSYPVTNPWKDPVNKLMAPFDQKFYLSMDVSVGGGLYFPDDGWNRKGKKPWENTSKHANLLFFEGRNDWYPTWEGDNGAMQIDYVKVYAI